MINNNSFQKFQKKSDNHFTQEELFTKATQDVIAIIKSFYDNNKNKTNNVDLYYFLANQYNNVYHKFL